MLPHDMSQHVTILTINQSRSTDQPESASEWISRAKKPEPEPKNKVVQR